jgi:O-acetyl-ADP-ribose deacetylase (regulator of RNase III)
MSDSRFHVIVGDITKREVSAVVNAANSSLLGGGGVDGAIHRAGGARILEECKQLRNDRWPDGLPTGRAVLTTGGNLPADYVIHTVGPVWRGGMQGEPELLARAVDSCLAIARDGVSFDPPIRSVAFPAISTGVYAFPRERAFPIIRDRIEAFLAAEAPPSPDFSHIELVLFSRNDLDAYQRVCR